MWKVNQILDIRLITINYFLYFLKYLRINVGEIKIIKIIDELNQFKLINVSIFNFYFMHINGKMKKAQNSR